MKENIGREALEVLELSIRVTQSHLVEVKSTAFAFHRGTMLRLPFYAVELLNSTKLTYFVTSTDRRFSVVFFTIAITFDFSC